MGINLNDMSKIQKVAGDDDDSVAVQASGSSDTVKSQQEKMNNFETKSEDIDNEQLKLPESAEYDAIIRMPTTEFAKIFQRLCIIDDNDAGVISVPNKDAAEFFPRGNKSTVKIIYQHMPEEAIAIEMNKPASTTFSLRQMKPMANKLTILSNKVTINLSNNQPLLIEYDIAQMFHAHFSLATMDEEDEEENQT